MLSPIRSEDWCFLSLPRQPYRWAASLRVAAGVNRAPPSRPDSDGQHLDLALEAVALAVLVAGVSALSHSQLVIGDDAPAGPSPEVDRPRDGPPVHR